MLNILSQPTLRNDPLHNHSSDRLEKKRFYKRLTFFSCLFFQHLMGWFSILKCVATSVYAFLHLIAFSIVFTFVATEVEKLKQLQPKLYRSRVNPCQYGMSKSVIHLHQKKNKNFAFGYIWQNISQLILNYATIIHKQFQLAISVPRISDLVIARLIC